MPQKQDIERFISATFRSVWALELLCFLRQTPDRVHSHDAMVAGLRGSDLVVSQSLESLVAGGLVAAEEHGAARYLPATPALDVLAGRAEALYQTSPDLVRRLIVSAANPSITAFADAFKLRKDRP